MSHTKFVSIFWFVLIFGTTIALASFSWYDIRTSLGPWIVMDVNNETTWLGLFLFAFPIVAKSLWLPACLSILIVWGIERYSKRH